MTVPVITVDAAFGSNPGGTAFSWTNIHTDTGTRRARSISYRRGRQNELNRIETGTGQITLGDRSSDFDPLNPTGAYSANVRPYVPIRAQATVGGTVYDLFQHFVSQWPRTLRDVRYTERQISTVDGFEWFARAGVAGGTYASETSGTRVQNVLDHIGWASTMRNLTGGQSTLGSVTFSSDDDTKALSHLLDVSDSENGLLYMNSAGKATFVSRSNLITGTAYAVSQATFRDGQAGGTTGYTFVSVTPSYDLETTFNDFRGTGPSGITQAASDTSSQGTYGLRTKTFTSFVTDDNEVLAATQWLLGKFKNPLNRIAEITVMPGTQTGFWQTVLALDIGSRITVIEKPPGYAGTVAGDYIIQSLEASFTAGPAQSARFSFGLWPADTNTYWQLGVTGASELGAATRLAY